jgi:hypothetical protein
MASIWRRVPECGQKRRLFRPLPDFGQGFAACAWRLRAWFAYALSAANPPTASRAAARAGASNADAEKKRE